MKGYGHIRTAKDYLEHARKRGERLQARRTGERAKRAAGGAAIAFYGLPAPVAEHRFHPVRRWRFDWAWIEQKIAVEQDGGLWIQGRHSRGAGQIKDNEKLNEAQALGWRVGRFTPQQVKSGEAAAWVKRLIYTHPAA